MYFTFYWSTPPCYPPQNPTIKQLSEECGANTEWWLNWLPGERSTLYKSGQVNVNTLHTCSAAGRHAATCVKSDATTETLEQITRPDLMGEALIYRKCKLNIPHEIIGSQTDSCRKSRQQTWTDSTTLQHTKRCSSWAGMLRRISWSSNSMFDINSNSGYLNSAVH